MDRSHQRRVVRKSWPECDLLRDMSRGEILTTLNQLQPRLSAKQHNQRTLMPFSIDISPSSPKRATEAPSHAFQIIETAALDQTLQTAAQLTKFMPHPLSSFGLPIWTRIIPTSSWTPKSLCDTAAMVYAGKVSKMGGVGELVARAPRL